MEEKKRITSRCWLVLFFGTVVLLAAAVMAFNFYTDPFGAFGDRFFQWWSYDETLNPRVAKFEYLKQHHEEYDSYIIGASNTSSYPTEQLNEYFDAKFYNMVMYGADMKDVEELSRYLIEHYTVKNLVVSIYIHDAVTYDTEPNALTYGMPWQADGSSPLVYYGKYLLSDPRTGLEKLRRRDTDPYLQQSYRVFDETTGAYDKSRRDVEPIGDLESYLGRDAYSGFLDYPTGSESLDALEQCMERMVEIKALCEENGVRLTVYCPPLYYENLAHYTPEQQAQFRNALAQVTDYWDFTLSSVSYDPRYFYDETHFRNAVGRMMLARAFGDDSVYCPEGLGEYVAKGDTPGAPTGQAAAEESYTAQVPILMYHHLAEQGQGDDIISVSRFEEQIRALSDAGYTAVSFEDLKAWVEQGTELPEKPVVITFDDGYESNYSLAYPILKKYGMKATIFVIGVSVGKDTYKDTGEAMIPHFSLEQAAEMEQSGLVDVESHGYDIHQVTGRDPEPIRKGVLPLAGESDWDYAEFLKEDCRKMAELLGKTPGVLAYPYGDCSELSEEVLGEMGVWATVTITEKTNTIVRGLPQSLRQMGRYYMKESISGTELLEKLK